MCFVPPGSSCASLASTRSSPVGVRGLSEWTVRWVPGWYVTSFNIILLSPIRTSFVHRCEIVREVVGCALFREMDAPPWRCSPVHIHALIWDLVHITCSNDASALVKVFNFSNGKSEKSYFMKRNPRNTRWTILYRRKHKKGTQEEASKKRTRRGNIKFNRAIQGATLESILQKRNQKPEVRKAQREQAIR